jgi:heme exporter protein C
MGIIGFADVLIVYFSVQWWPGIHPEPVVGPQAVGDALDPTMRAVLLFSFATFFSLMLYLVLERMALRKIEDRVRDARLMLRRGGG